MGGKGSKTKGQGKPPTLKSSDIKFLTKQTGLDQAAIKATFEKFMANNPDGQLDRKEFVRLYDELRPESMDRLDEISQYVFRAFDKDNNGTISFNEFLVSQYFSMNLLSSCLFILYRSNIPIIFCFRLLML